MPGEGFSKVYITTALINAVSSTVNGYFSRKQQRELAVQNQRFTQQMEANRQNFQLQINQLNVETQREMSKLNHQLRLEEQRNNFNLMCESTEWQFFLRDWPLWVQPRVLREEQILNDGTVALRVFFAKSNNKLFSNYVYPKVEQGLLEFVDNYRNIFGSNNLFFYHNAYKENAYGGAFNTNIRYALRELPVMIIDSNVLSDEICVSATVWGFGNALEQHATLFKLPYKLVMVDGNVDMKYVNDLSNRLLAYLKFVLGYVYDTYNLIMYNQPPLLPQIARFELENKIASAPLRYQGIQDAFGEHYGEIYSAVLGMETKEKAAGFAERPESFKKTVLYELRFKYAESVKEFVTVKDYLEILDESVQAWVELRTELGADEFLDSLKYEDNRINEQLIHHYFSKQDAEYFNSLCKAYSSVELHSSIGDKCLCLFNDIKKLKDSLADIPAANEVIKTGAYIEKADEHEPAFLEL